MLHTKSAYHPFRLPQRTLLAHAHDRTAAWSWVRSRSTSLRCSGRLAKLREYPAKSNELPSSSVRSNSSCSTGLLQSDAFLALSHGTHAVKRRVEVRIE